MFIHSSEWNTRKNGDNQLIIEDPIIRNITDKTASGTYIQYHPSSVVFPNMVLPERFIRSRIFEFAAANPKIKVYYNKELIKVKPKIEQTLFGKTKTIVIDINDEENDAEVERRINYRKRWLIVTENEFEQYKEFIRKLKYEVMTLDDYELIFNRLIFIFMRKSPFFQKWFIGDIFNKKVEEPIEEEKAE